MSNHATQESREDIYQLVSFEIADEEFGIDILKVQEIIRLVEITHMPHTPAFVEGVINLRGQIIPVVDLRKRFELPVEERTKDTRVVVVDIAKADLGVIVDAVTEVLHVSGESIEPPMAVAATEAADYLIGTAKLDNRLIIMLDLARLLAGDDLKWVNPSVQLDSLAPSA